MNTRDQWRVGSKLFAYYSQARRYADKLGVKPQLVPAASIRPLTGLVNI